MDQNQFPFSNLPLELQVEILSIYPEGRRTAPLLSKTVPEKFVSLACELPPSRKEFRDFLIRHKPLKFAVNIAYNACHLFEYNFSTNAHWKNYRIWLQPNSLPLDPSKPLYRIVNDSISGPGSNIDHLVEFIYGKNKFRQFDMLTLYKMLKDRPQCSPYLEKNFKISVDKLLDEITYFASPTNKHPYKELYIHIDLIPYAWIFNLGELIYDVPIPSVEALTIVNKTIAQLNAQLISKITDFSRAIPLISI